MNAVVDQFDHIEDFFAPASTDMIDGLIARYNFDRKRIQEVSAFANGDGCRGVLHYFLTGNATDERGRLSMEMSASQLFSVDGAIAQLNASYWQEALNLTDVYDAMPQNRRNEWNEQIKNPRGVKKDYHQKRRDQEASPELFDEKGEYINPADGYKLAPLPDFEDKSVRSTLADLLSLRHQFLSERVDGIFRALSGEHVTNSPAAFSKRMIVAYLFNSYDTVNHDRVGYINDLRCVIAKFMGREEPKWYSSSKIVEHARRYRRGEWVTLDGGALRLRAYKCGTAHLEVHPDMAYRLNQILAYMHPMAIPPEFRQKPKRKSKEFVMMSRPLPFAVIDLLAGLRQEPTIIHLDRWTEPKLGYTQNQNAKRFDIRSDQDNKQALEEAHRVQEYLGGVRMTHNNHFWFEFDYNPDEVLADIVCSGCVPDQKSHQFYPTPESVAMQAIELADIGVTDKCLEPSAGIGHIADLLPKGRTYCVEISPLHSEVLRAKGHEVITMDFLEFSGRYDRIVMNPPFSEGRWQAHVAHAASMLNDAGRLVAIVPSSAANKYELPGFTIKSTAPIHNEFSGTSVSVVILTVERSE
jgi:predicted RNA methylase